MVLSDEEPAGSSSGVAQYPSGDTAIRSRRNATDAASVTAPPAPPNPIPAQEQERHSEDEWYTTDKGSSSESVRRTASPEPRPESPRAKTPEEKQCRICLAGPEEEAELGRLISPCHCRGSIRVSLHFSPLEYVF